MRHRDYFIASHAAHDSAGHIEIAANQEGQSAKHHALPLLAYVPFIVLLAKQIARPIDYGINVFRAPAALGGLLVATLILSPESSGRGARSPREPDSALDQPRARHCALSISLTIPAVLIIGFLTDKTIIFGLHPSDMVLLLR